jgi:hypothetical protein
MSRRVTDKNLAERQVCELFLNNPGVNPETGKKLIYGKGPYNTYIAMCKKHNIDVGTASIKQVEKSSQKAPLPATKTQHRSCVTQFESSNPRHFILTSDKSPKMTKTEPQSVPSAYKRRLDLPEGFTGVEELDLAILLNLDMETLHDLRFTSKWINRLLNSRAFLDDYSTLSNLCPLKIYNNFDELYQSYLTKYKNFKKYVTDCLEAASPDNVDLILDFIEDITLSTGPFQHGVIKPIARYGKKELLLKALNMYFERFDNYAIDGTIGLILGVAAESGNIDVINEVLSKYGKIFDRNDLIVLKTTGVWPYVEIAVGAAIGNHYDILKNALEKIIGTGALDIRGNYDKIIGEIFGQATYQGGETTEALLLETLKELGIAENVMH